MLRSSFTLGVCVFVVGLAGAAHAGTIGYWRMEQDLDSGPNLSIGNEFVGGSNLISSNAALFPHLPNLPNGIPQTGEPNTGSIGSTTQGSSDGINASAAAYAALNVPSITIEFWARTVENDADLFVRNNGTADNGIIIDQPGNLRIRFWVDDGSGGAQQRTMTGLFDMDDAWNHFAFAYDHLTGVAEFFVDGASVGTDVGTAGSALVWDPNEAVRLGVRMDFAEANQGTLDEVRIDNRALNAGQLLHSPEPGTGLMLALGLVGLGLRGRKNRLPRR